MWAFETTQASRELPTEEDLAPFINKAQDRQDIAMSCPLSDKKGQFSLSYVINTVDTPPECLLGPDHTLWGGAGTELPQPDVGKNKDKKEKKDKKDKKGGRN